MTIPIGTKVRVSISGNEQIPNNPIKALDGCEFTITGFKTVKSGANKTSQRTYYTLDGAESKMGVPYVFLEEDLKVL